MDIYKEFTEAKGEFLTLRQLKESDFDDLFKVYSDKKAVEFFNSDNCNDDFYYDTLEKMRKGFDFWVFAVKNRFFIRLTIFDNNTNEAVGTIEAFARFSNDAITDTVLLRLDLRSDYEQSKYIKDVLQLVESFSISAFNVNKISTKGFYDDCTRAKTLLECGYKKESTPLVVDGGAKFFNYYTKKIG